MAGARRRRRWLVPEVVQTSAMDCGPASLKCILEGFHVPVSYGRLREACQTDVDGTSIDTIEGIAHQLGFDAEQVMIPADHLFLAEARALPAVVVVQRSDGATHFVVVWSKHGEWLQVMDPAAGRAWVRRAQFAQQLFRHEMLVPAAEWADWARSEDFLAPLRRRLADLGASQGEAQALVDDAIAEGGWFGLGTLDAAVRFAGSVLRAGGLGTGGAARLVASIVAQTRASTEDIFRAIPRTYWSAVAHKLDEDGKLQLMLRGAVLVRFEGPRAARTDATDEASAPPASRELAAALSEPPLHPLRSLWQMLRADGVLGLVALSGAVGLAAGAVLLEMLLFRGLFDISGMLNLGGQRLLAVAALLAFGLLLLAIEFPIAMETLRFGRHLETRLRMALLAKLPRLGDRYFHSRPVSDMADRSHGLVLLRAVPALGLQLVQALCGMAFTLVGIAIIDPHSVGLALAVVAVAMVLPLVVQPFLNERDLRVRSHAGALNGFYLDALLALVPIRTHGAQLAVRRRHEGLLVEWARSARGLVRLSLGVDAVQSLICLGLAGWLLLDHFQRIGGTGGGDLLLVYWALKLPASGHALAELAQQYPVQRNVLMRLMEPLSTPEALPDGEGAEPAPEAAAAPAPTHAASVQIRGGQVLASGHEILQDIALDIAPGEHVAIVGSSGAGKSSLVGVLLGWHRLAAGSLRIDGAPAGADAIAALRSRTAWVDPATQIWNRSFLDNLQYAVDGEALQRTGPVIAAADLRPLLEKLPQGLQTWLGEGGALLSGGEGQRVRLARALMQDDVRLALLDEPFRGLDRGQRNRLLAEARAWWRQATLLCVTHDVGDTLAFDRVIVIEGGRIVEDDAPAALAARASRYRELLDAENAVRRDLWRSRTWRHLRVQDGRVADSGPRPLDDDAAPAKTRRSA